MIGSSFLGIIDRNRHFDGGRGTAASPYRITKIRHFNNIRRYTSNTHYRLENDIIFTDEFEEDGEYYNNGALWIPISTFTGVFDGQGYKIENLKSIFASQVRGTICNYLGTNSTIKNIYIKNVYVNRSGNYNIHGGVVGQGTSTSTIEGVYLDGNLTFGYTGGGILGRAGIVRRCAVNAAINATEYSGGIAGGSSTWQYIYDCYTRGSLYAPNHRACIHGSTFGARVYNSYSYMQLVNSGANHLKRGIISYYDSSNLNGESYDCYWDTQVTTAALSYNNNTGLTVGLTTTQSKYPYPAYNETDQAYAGWDFDTIWAHDVDGTINNGYPYLRDVTPIK